MIRTIIFILCFYSLIFTQNSWQVIKEATIKLQANYGFFLDENTGWIYGANGAIIHTSDGGLTWQIQRDTSSINATINDMFFIDQSHGWACGNNGTILQTNNGGTTWNLITGLPTNANLNGINFVNSSVGYACGDGGDIIHTENGGDSWVLQSSNTTSNLEDISFFNSDTGFAVISTSNNNVVWTSTGGLFWEYKSYPGQSIPRMYDCKAVRGTSNAWMIGYYGNIYHSTNYGQNWSLSKSIFGTEFVYAKAIDFVNTNVGFAGSKDGIVFRTLDSGATWDSVSIGTNEDINNIFVLNTNTIIAVGNQNQLRKSTDAGNTWTPVIDWPRVLFRDICIVDSSSFFACTFGGDISSTSNAGINISFPNSKNLPTTNSIESIKFFNENIGFYGGYLGQIAKTINGGLTWYQTNVSGELKTVYNFAFFNQDTMWACASSGKIYKSYDGGENWQELADVGTTLYALHFFDNLVGVTAGSGGMIYRTINGGVDWSIVSNIGSLPLRNFGFINSSIGFLVGYNGALIKTVDAGISWDLIDTLAIVNSTTFDVLWDIEFVSDNEGWICAGSATGERGHFYHTTNSADSWQKVDSPSDYTIRSIDFLSPYNGWAVGDYGTILKYDVNDGIERRKNQKMPNSFQLYANYPNPFNPSTNIMYYINKAGNAELAIYNINGQKIKTIIKEYQTPGNYKYVWNGTDNSGKKVSSGAYFYQLKLGKNINAKRMILLK